MRISPFLRHILTFELNLVAARHPRIRSRQALKPVDGWLAAPPSKTQHEKASKQRQLQEFYKNKMEGESYSIEVSGMQFSYDANSPLFFDFNLKISPGSRSLLVGANGSGAPLLLNFIINLDFMIIEVSDEASKCGYSLYNCKLEF